MGLGDDINLGVISLAEIEDQFDQSESPMRRSAPRDPVAGIRFGLLLSACMHLALASVVIYFLPQDAPLQEDVLAAAIRVEFVPRNPFTADEPPIEVEESTNSAPAIDEPPLATPPLEAVPPQPEPQLPQDEIAQRPREAAAVVTLPEPVLPQRPQQRELLSVPNADAVRSAILSIREGEFNPNQDYDCNKLEREAAFSDCSDADARDYTTALQNPVYDFFSPGIQVSRSRATVTALAENSGEVAASLSLTDLPEGLSAYVLEEIEQGIETHSNSSSRTLGHMNSMVDKSAAGAMARRLFDPWVLQQSQKIKERQAPIP